MTVVQINGELRSVAANATLADVVSEFGLAEKRVAIELNGEVIRRSHWAETPVREGAKIEIVHFVGGG